MKRRLQTGLGDPLQFPTDRFQLKRAVLPAVVEIARLRP